MSKPDAYDRIKRRARLDETTAKREYPTSEGNRKAATRGPSIKERLKGPVRNAAGKALSNANSLRGVTDPAADGINERKKYKKVE